MSRLARSIKFYSDTAGLWRRGRAWTAIRLGLPASVIFAAILFAVEGRAMQTGLEAAMYGVLFGAGTSVLLWRRWPDARRLSPEDRVAIVRVVRQGRRLDEARLAPPVLRYVAVVRASVDRAQHQRWVLWVAGMIILSLAFTKSVHGSIRPAAIFWALTALWALMLVRNQRQLAQTLSNASRAEVAANQLLGASGSG